MSDPPVSPITNTISIQINPRLGNNGNNNSVDPSSSNTITSGSLIPLEDCKCPICLDYFIDVVETRCHHRFCNFCLENWLRVGMYRQCPTCRSIIQGSLQVKPDLQNLIDSSVNLVLSEEEIRERHRIRSERQAQVTRFSADREQTQALLARINSSRPPVRHYRRSSRRLLVDVENAPRETTGNTSLPQHIWNWWDDNRNDASVPVAAPADFDYGITPLNWSPISQVQEQVANITDLGWVRRVRDLHLEEHADTLSATQESMNLAPSPSRNIPVQVSAGSTSERQRSRASSSHFDQSYHENLMQEYNYHLRRVNSAHTRIREAYRDFNYHNGRMQEILNEHRSFFSSSGAREPNGMESLNVNGSDNNNESDELSYEDLIGLEMGELLDHSPAARLVVSDRNGLADFLPLANELVPSQNHPMRPFTFGHETGSNNENIYPSRHGQVNSGRLPAPTPVPLPYRTSVLDMEQEIRNRRNQLNRLSSLIRQSPWNSDVRYSRNSLSNHGPTTIPNSSATPLSTPLQFAQPQMDMSARQNRARRSTGQHQLMVERLTGINNNLTSAPFSPSRRMRRRLARTNLSRANTTDISEQLPAANNLYRENNTALPREVNGPNVNSCIAEILNSPSPIVSNNATQNQAERESNRVLPSSAGWIAESTEDSEEDEIVRQLTRASLGIPQSRENVQRATTTVPPTTRNFQRALRFQQRQPNTLPSESNSGSTVTGPASSSNTNTSTVATLNDDLSSITNALMNSDDDDDEEHVDRVVVDASSNGNDNLQSSESAEPTSTEDNNSESVLIPLNDMASVNAYLRNLCDKFKSQ